MIAKSDLIILVVSSTLLGVAIYRWDQNTRNVDTSTVLANTTVTAPANNTSSNAATDLLTSTGTGNNNPSSTQGSDTQVTAAPSVVVVEPVVVETVTAYSTYTVRSGDSLSAIASRYNTTVRELQSINGINGSVIFVGQEIQYPNN